MPTASTTLTNCQIKALRKRGPLSRVLRELVVDSTGLPGPRPKRRGRPPKRKTSKR